MNDGPSTNNNSRKYKEINDSAVKRLAMFNIDGLPILIAASTIRVIKMSATIYKNISLLTSQFRKYFKSVLCQLVTSSSVSKSFFLLAPNEYKSDSLVPCCAGYM